MRKSTIKHENLRKIIEDIQSSADETSDETFIMLIEEVKHSCLIVAGDIRGDTINVMTVKTDKGDFGMLFTDLDEYRKVFSNFEVEAHDNSFARYQKLLENSDLLGYIINFAGEGMILPRELLIEIDDVPSHSYPIEGSYTSVELKSLKESIDNSDLEEFIADSRNIGRYEELFEIISKSTLLTLMLSRTDLKANAEDGVISMLESEPLGFLYTDRLGGEYATVYTSEEKISSVKTPHNKYSQIVNFSCLAEFVLHDDMDGIIINPGWENVVITRDVLLEFSTLLDRTCNDSRLNSAIYHMFLLEDEAYV